MKLTVIDPPTDPVVTLEEARDYLRSETADDAIVERLVDSVSDWVAGEHGWLRRSLMPWTLELRLPAFPAPVESVRLPRPPLIEVESVSYTDSDGNPATVDSEVYRVTRWADGFAWIGLVAGESWPDGTDVRIRYRAGYETDDSPPEPNVPEGLKQAILATVARQYEFREEGLPSRDDAFVSRLFAPYRVYE